MRQTAGNGLFASPLSPLALLGVRRSSVHRTGAAYRGAAAAYTAEVSEQAPCELGELLPANGPSVFARPCARHMR